MILRVTLRTTRFRPMSIRSFGEPTNCWDSSKRGNQPADDRDAVLVVPNELNMVFP